MIGRWQTADDLFDDVFSPIARDGAGTLEVGIRLQKAFRSLSEMGRLDLSEAAKRHSTLALRRSLAAIELDEDRSTLEGLAAQVGT